MTEFDAEIERKEKDEEFYGRLADMKSDIDIEKLKTAVDLGLAMKPDQRPVLTAVGFLCCPER